MAYKLKSEYVEQLKTDSILLGTVAAAVGVVPATILTWCRKESDSLTLIAVLVAICKYNQIEHVDDLIEYVDVSLEKAA